MEAFLPEVSWRQLIVAAIVLMLLYFLVQWLGNRLRRMSLRKTARLLRPIGRFMMVFYEPIAATILLGIFFLVNPLLHGLLLLILLLLGYHHLKNYLSGRLVQLGFDLQTGKQLEIGPVSGVITRLGRLGIYLQNNNGQHYLAYSGLLSGGYTLLSNEDAGGIFSIAIHPPEEVASPEQSRRDLANRLVKVPYVDWSHHPVIQQEEQSSHLTARIFIHEEKQLPELLQLVKEWGYTCEVINKK
jgi:hypothetical protein